MTTDNTNPQTGAGRLLPKKEQDMFRSLMKHYDMKQYKKALKQADSILKKFPMHGETLAMKGLTLYFMSKREDAFALVKEGLRNDMTSHVCWHVYGLLHRSDRNYNEAIKAYKGALRIDPENLSILRDLSMLQVQMRDLDGFEATRAKLLTLKPNAKINWMAYAIAKHLLGDLKGAIQLIDTYLGTLTEGSEELGRCYESSELALYKNSIIAELPDNYDEALKHLTLCEGVVVDRGAWLFSRAEYLLKQQDFAGAKMAVLSLFQRGMTENYRVHSMFMCALLETEPSVCDRALKLRGSRTLASLIPLKSDQKRILHEAYKSELQPLYPKSYAVYQILIILADGQAFHSAIDRLCRRHLLKGVPSLCSELCSFMWTERDDQLIRPVDAVDIRQHPYMTIYTAIVDGFLSSLASCSKFSPDDDVDAPSSAIFWCWYLRAGLHELVGEFTQALALLDRCLEHTPTAVDAFELKARLLKQSGDLQGAVECIDKGRELDRQDRYTNNMTTMYMLQAGMEEQALKTISLFARHEGNPEVNLYDMQCSWYELELAACCSRRGDFGRSLKKYAAVAKHFEEIHEDQFDFHGYCLRRVTLRSYVDLLRFEDTVYGEDYYVRAAVGAIDIYLRLFDRPTKSEAAEPDYASMTAAERKKAKAIARKKKKAVEKEESEALQTQPANGNDGKQSAKSGKPSFIELDPTGKELLAKDPLEEATKFADMLVRYAPGRFESWIARFDVSIRRHKVLMALQALYKARSIDGTSSKLFTRIVQFFQRMDTFKDLSGPAQVILKEAAPILLNGKDVVSFVRDAADSVSRDPLTALPLRTAVATAMVETKAGGVADACALIIENGLQARAVSVETCREALVALGSFANGDQAAAQKWISMVLERFPLLSNFD